jgi:hypothetical protein
VSVYKLSPSDFAFLWEQCKRCFHLKVARGIRQPSMPMAGIFKRIEGLQMSFYDGKPTGEVAPGVPPGKIRCGERWVESRVIEPKGRQSAGYISGKLDTLLEFDDRSWGVLDFKTTLVKPEQAAKYSRQLHAYAFSLENPSPAPKSMKGEAPRLSPISRLGLLCFEPSELRVPVPGRQAYEGEARWLEIPRDEKAFLEFVSEVLALLDGPLPDPSSDCDWCSYARTMSSLGSAPPAAPSSTDTASCPKCGAPMRRRDGKFGPFMSCTRYPACKGTRNLDR